MTHVKRERRSYSAPKLLEFGCLVELTKTHGPDHGKAIGLTDSFFLISTGEGLCEPGVDCIS